ncbi:MAG: rhomboid family intramembrane serine protease [Thermoleophilia bacterium]
MIPIGDVNPTRRPPVLTIGLIVACVLVFLYQLTLPDDLSLEGRQAFFCEFGLVADHLLEGVTRTGDACVLLNHEHPRGLSLVTSQFIHADLWHLLFNMLFLWVFGNNVEDRLGRVRFVPFYLLCGAIAGLAQAATDPSSGIPLIGASGAISGVLGAYLVLFPKVRVWTVVFPLVFLPFKLPAWVWLAAYFVLQLVLLGDMGQGDGGGVAYLAHIGGFVAGALLIRPFLAGRRDPDPPSPAIGTAW